MEERGITHLLISLWLYKSNPKMELAFFPVLIINTYGNLFNFSRVESILKPILHNSSSMKSVTPNSHLLANKHKVTVLSIYHHAA